MHTNEYWLLEKQINHETRQNLSEAPPQIFSCKKSVLENINIASMDWHFMLQKTVETELWTFVSLNLGIVYLRSNRTSDLVSLLERVDPDRLDTWWVSQGGRFTLCNEHLGCVMCENVWNLHDNFWGLEGSWKWRTMKDSNKKKDCK